MTQFSKKYNYKNIKPKLNKTNKWKKIYSRSFPSDQKIHPWCLFSAFLQDYYWEINNLLWNQTSLAMWFWLSSQWYAKLNDPSINLRQLELDIKKQLKQNNKFFDKLWFHDFIDNKSFVLSEEFNIFLRDIFVDLYKAGKVFSQKEVVLRSKSFQTNLFKNNVKIEKKDSLQFVMKYFVESKGLTILVPAKNIETIFADVAVAVNPQDKRYKKLIWQNVIIPIINKSIPIIWDETVDSFNGSWVVRITPWHDEYGLEIAKKHNLPIDVFAVDTDWKFTNNAWEFSNKPVNDFIDNVIKYIDDIWNLDSKNKVSKNSFFDVKSWEELYKITLDQWNIKYDYAIDYLVQQIAEEKLKIFPANLKDDVSDYLNEISSINISNKSIKWVLIPILKWPNNDFYVINQDILIEKYNKSRSRKDISLTAIILNLILDNQLYESFNLEDLIDALFAYDFSNATNKLSKYIQIYENHINSDYKVWLKSLKKLLGKIDNDIEKVKLVSEFLDNSFAIDRSWDNFYFNFWSIFGFKHNIILQNKDSFNKEFIDSVQFVYQNNLVFSNADYSSVKNLENIFMWPVDEKEFCVNSLLLSLDFTKNLIFSDLFFHQSLLDQKWNKINNYNSKFLTKEIWEYFDIYWQDLMRLLFLSLDKTNEDVTIDTYKINNLNYILNKIWNANRYVYSKYVVGNKKIKMQKLLQDLEHNITDYDWWIMHNLISLIDDMQYQFKEKKIIDIWRKILHFVNNDLYEKYIESIKIYNQKNTSSVVLFVFAISLRLLKPIFPFFVSEIESIFDFDRWDYNVLDIKKLNLKEKNYKINIFMDIVDKLKNLKQKLSIKKHEEIDVFVQANQEFVSFLSDNESLLRSLINIWHIDYIRLHENLPVWYEIDNVININIWAKKVLQQSEVTKDLLWEINEDLNNKKEYLQHLKSLMISIVSSAPIEIVNKKKQDIHNLQQEIEELELSVNKLRVKNHKST